VLIIIPLFTTRLTEVTRDLQHHHHHHHSQQQDNDQPLDMSKPNQPRERGPPTSDTAHLFSGLHLLVDAAMGVLEARRGPSSSRNGGGGNFPPLRD
jgi:hypothetical protein